MSPRRVGAVARRVVAQFRRDRRSVALLVVAPMLVLSLVGAIWGSTEDRVPTVAVATDRGSVALPPAIVDRLVASTEIAGRRTTFDEGMRQLRDGEADAVAWLEGTRLHVEVEGADPLAGGGVGAAVTSLLRKLEQRLLRIESEIRKPLRLVRR
ncbi:MAG: hypothetical protein ACRDF0_01100 [Candidatus Limnocylindria bacterium]